MASDFTYPVLFDRAKQIRVNAGIPGPIPVNHLHLLNPSVWRLAGFYSHIYSFYFYYAFWFVWLISWYELRLGALIVARWFPKSRFRDVVRDIPPGREIIMALSLRILAKAGRKAPWGLFWFIYFMFGNRNSFFQDYIQAWKEQFAQATVNPQVGQNAGPCSVLMSKDNGSTLEIPCRWNMSDQEFIEHVRNFYYLLRIEMGFFECLSLKDLIFIEIVEIAQHPTGPVTQEYLNLGRYGFNGSLIRFWHLPSELTNRAIVDKLIKDAVLATAKPPAVQNQPAGQNQPSGGHQKSLNMVSRWDTSAIATVAAIPLILSVLFCVLWSIISVSIYNADVNVSVQTGFAIGSYIITAGALIIALVAFLDTQKVKIEVP